MNEPTFPTTAAMLSYRPTPIPAPTVSPFPRPSGNDDKDTEHGINA